jgi:hypothetical protein
MPGAASLVQRLNTDLVGGAALSGQKLATSIRECNVQRPADVAGYHFIKSRRGEYHDTGLWRWSHGIDAAGGYPMCDYSLELYRSRQAVNEEHYTLHRFGSGTLGFIAESDCTTAICMPAGVRLLLDGLDKRLQRGLRVGATEEVVMIRLPFRNHTHRDGVRFANGREVMLQDLNTGLSAILVPRDLTAIFDLKGMAEPASGETEAFVPAVDRRGSGATMSSASPAHIVGLIGQHCVRMARTFRQATWRRFAVSAGRPSIKGEYLDVGDGSLRTDAASAVQHATSRSACSQP